MSPLIWNVWPQFWIGVWYKEERCIFAHIYQNKTWWLARLKYYMINILHQLVLPKKMLAFKAFGGSFPESFYVFW